MPLPSYSKKTQWDTLDAHIEKLSSDPESCNDQIILGDIDQSVLFTLLTKKRTEIDILESNTLSSPAPSPHRHSGNSSPLIFPKYDAAFPRSNVTSPIDQESPLTISIPRRKSSQSLSFEDNGAQNPRVDSTTDLNFAPFTINDDSGSDHRVSEEIEVSPLSPTFGPRRGEIPSGTLERRRVSLPTNQYRPSNSSESHMGENDQCLTTASCEVFGPVAYKERRIIWEAAWKEIEGNLEHYLAQFGGGEETTTGPVQAKERLWNQLLHICKHYSAIEGRWSCS